MATAIASPGPPSAPPATIDDLDRVEGKAELINGRIVRYRATGDLPGAIALEIVLLLREFARQTGIGAARGDNIGFALPKQLKNGRKSFSPDASYYSGPLAREPDEIYRRKSRRSPSKCGARGTIRRRPSEKSLPSEPIISRRAHGLCGMSIRWPRQSRCIRPLHQRSPSLFARARSPTPSRPFQGGRLQ